MNKKKVREFGIGKFGLVVSKKLDVWSGEVNDVRLSFHCALSQ